MKPDYIDHQHMPQWLRDEASKIEREQRRTEWLGIAMAIVVIGGSIALAVIAWGMGA